MTLRKNRLTMAQMNECKLQGNSSELISILELLFKQLQQTEISHYNCAQIMEVWPNERRRQNAAVCSPPLCLDLQVLLQLYTENLAATSSFPSPSPSEMLDYWPHVYNNEGFYIQNFIQSVFSWSL